MHGRSHPETCFLWEQFTNHKEQHAFHRKSKLAFKSKVSGFKFKMAEQEDPELTSLMDTKTNTAYTTALSKNYEKINNRFSTTMDIKIKPH